MTDPSTERSVFRNSGSLWRYFVFATTRSLLFETYALKRDGPTLRLSGDVQRSNGMDWPKAAAARADMGL